MKTTANWIFWMVVMIAFVLSLSTCQSMLSELPEASNVADVPTVLCVGNAALPDIDALPSPKLRDNIGNAQLNITTSVIEAQIWFNQGLNLLHSFWHLEAYRAFKQVVQLDPKCAMGYWGMAMCQPGFGGEAQTWSDAIEKAEKLQTGVSDLEIGLIHATNILLKKGIGKALPYFKEIMKSYPENPDAIAFAVLMMRQSARTETQSQKVKILLENALRRFPDHAGLQHYYVHTMEVRPDFTIAKPIALKMAQQAAGVPHLLHMPGHLYFIEGNYVEAAAVFEQARLAEQRYHQEENISKITDQNYLHNLHYLAVTYSELNEYKKALEVANEYAYITMKQPTPTTSNELILLYEGRILPALVHIRFRNYDKAIEQLSFWQNSPDFPIHNESVFKYLQTMEMYCRGMKDILDGNEEEAIRRSGLMKKHIAEFEFLAQSKGGAGEMAHFNKTHDIMMMAWYELVGWGVNMNFDGEFISEPWAKAFQLEKAIGYEEPPRLMYPIAESKAMLHKKRGEQSLLLNL